MCDAHLCGSRRSSLLWFRALLIRVLLQRKARLPLHHLHRKYLSAGAGLCAGRWFQEVFCGWSLLLRLRTGYCRAVPLLPARRFFPCIGFLNFRLALFDFRSFEIDDIRVICIKKVLNGLSDSFSISLSS